MITLSPADSQILLYAKGHFGANRPNVIQDMKILVANRAGMSPEHINERDIIIILLFLIEEIGEKRKLSRPEFLLSIIYNEYYKGNSIAERAINELLSIIHLVPVLDVNNERTIQFYPINRSLLS